MDHPIISADGHIDLPVLPENLWAENAPAALRERMPHVVEKPTGKVWVSAKGKELGLVGGMGSAGRPYIPGEIHRSDRMAEVGLFRDQRAGIMRTATPELRVRDQELDGVSAEVVYGILGAGARLDDDEVCASMTHTYNAWLAEFCAKAPGRFAGIGCLAHGDHARAAAEIERCARLGLAGVELGMTPDMLPLWHDDWEPIWRTAHETGLPVHLHTTGPRTDQRWAGNPSTYRRWLATHMCAFQVPMYAVLSAILFGGAPERYPTLKIVLGESGIGWLPYALERLDYEWEDQFRDIIPRPPTEYWRRQFYATFQIDHTGLKNLDAIGAGNVMWGSDFPHPDGTWPDSRAILEPQLALISAADRRKILFENARDLYKFPIAG
jgi:predicted TIM-barrel fold metal-dependent hydrolase